MADKRVLIPYRNEVKVQPYVTAARTAGLEPIAVSVANPIAFNGYDALILMGGTDVNPQRYGQSALPETDKPDDERDEVEFALLSEAMERDKPVLAICRGLQLLNVHLGGTLVQHLNLPKHDPGVINNKGDAVHQVAFEPQSRLATIAGAPSWGVNSRHHQAIAKVGANLHIAARDPEDGLVEALEHGDRHFIVAVQWHPEDQIFEHPEHLKLFQSLAAATLP